MIRIRYGKTPPSLDGPTSVGGKETAAAIAFYDAGKNRTVVDGKVKDTDFDFKAYKEPDVTAALNAEFHGKCAYCESVYEATAPVDAEHYRPKGGYVKDGKLTRPGYFWLAATWRNLLPSCSDCNRKRYQQFADEPDRLSGKANLFPIKSERRRATAPGQEAKEGRLLLHPRLDDPRPHLEFVDGGGVRPRELLPGLESARGAASIAVYGLTRDPLARRRRDRQIEVDGAVGHLERSVDDVRREPLDPLRRYYLALDVAALRRMTTDEAPYAAMARQRAEKILGAVEAEFGPQDPNPVRPPV
jgi:uncharacterized protein (TIGR02646 family)